MTAGTILGGEQTAPTEKILASSVNNLRYVTEYMNLLFRTREHSHETLYEAQYLLHIVISHSIARRLKVYDSFGFCVVGPACIITTRKADQNAAMW